MWVVKMYVGDDVGVVARFSDTELCYNWVLAAVSQVKAKARDWIRVARAIDRTQKVHSRTNLECMWTFLLVETIDKRRVYLRLLKPMSSSLPSPRHQRHRIFSPSTTNLSPRWI